MSAPQSAPSGEAATAPAPAATAPAPAATAPAPAATVQSPAATTPAPATAEAPVRSVPEPVQYVPVHHQDDSLDLLSLVGPVILKRLVPVVGAAAVVGVVTWGVRRLRRRRTSA